MALVALAENAQEVASEFLEFEGFLPAERATDISALATELFSLKTHLLALHAAQKDPRNRRRVDYVDDECYIVTQSLGFTFDDVHAIIGTLGDPVYRSRAEGYRVVWRKLEDHFYEESKNELITRLQYYKDFVQELIELVVGEEPHPDFDDLLDKIDYLLEVQKDSRLANDLGNLQVSTPKVRSFERARPFGLDSNGQPNGRGRQKVHQKGRQPGQRMSPSPESTIGSPSTATASSFAESSSTDSSMHRHWIVDVFAQNRTTTQFKTTGSESSCFADHQRGASAQLKEKHHKKVLTLPFENLEIRIYVRPSDHRARILCRMERRGRRFECTQPVSKLRILRKASCLQLYKFSSTGKLQLWANLRFPSYERLVLFHCCFLAMKAQDEVDEVRDLDDHILQDEKHIFSGKIIDDNYEHALQILKDEDSGGVRLQASVLKGDMKRAPVWTAFINYSMMASKWIRRPERSKIHLNDLSRYIFFDDYQPQMAPSGAHELHFQTRESAKEFLQVIEDVAEGRI